MHTVTITETGWRALCHSISITRRGRYREAGWWRKVGRMHLRTRPKVDEYRFKIVPDVAH